MQQEVLPAWRGSRHQADMMSPALTFYSHAKMTHLAFCLVCALAVDAFGKSLPCKYYLSLSVVYCNPLIMMPYFIFQSFMKQDKTLNRFLAIECCNVVTSIQIGQNLF